MSLDKCHQIWCVRDFPVGSESLQCRRPMFDPLVGKIPWRQYWQPTPVFLPGKSHEQRILASYNLWGHKELDMTKRLTNTHQFSSVAQSCPTLCDPMNCSTPGLPVHHQFLEFTQIHIHRVSDAIQPSHLLSSPSPPAPKPSQHQSLFQ